MEHCNCNKINDSEFLGPKVEKLTSTIEADGVPLVKLTRNRRGIFTVDVVEYKFGQCTFTAISHVWSGGLGNPRHNTLPPRQLEFIYNSARLWRQQPYYENLGVFEPSDDFTLSAKSEFDPFVHRLKTKFSELLLSGTFKRSSS